MDTIADILEYAITETTAIAKLYQFDFPAGFTFLIKSLFFTQNPLSRTIINFLTLRVAIAGKAALYLKGEILLY